MRKRKRKYNMGLTNYVIVFGNTQWLNLAEISISWLSSLNRKRNVFCLLLKDTNSSSSNFYLQA